MPGSLPVNVWAIIPGGCQNVAEGRARPAGDTPGKKDAKSPRILKGCQRGGVRLHAATITRSPPNPPQPPPHPNPRICESIPGDSTRSKYWVPSKAVEDNRTPRRYRDKNGCERTPWRRSLVAFLRSDAAHENAKAQLQSTRAGEPPPSISIDPMRGTGGHEVQPRNGEPRSPMRMGGERWDA